MSKFTEYVEMQPSAGDIVVINHRFYEVRQILISDTMTDISRLEHEYRTLATCLQVSDNGEDVGHETTTFDMDAYDWKMA